MARTTLSDDIESLKAVGHGAIALVNTAILLALVAVILSKNSNTPNVIQQAFSVLTWLVQSAISPVQAATGNTAQTAGSQGGSQSGSTATGSNLFGDTLGLTGNALGWSGSSGTNAGGIDTGGWDGLTSGTGNTDQGVWDNGITTMVITPS